MSNRAVHFEKILHKKCFRLKFAIIKVISQTFLNFFFGVQAYLSYLCLAPVIEGFSSCKKLFMMSFISLNDNYLGMFGVWS